MKKLVMILTVGVWSLAGFSNEAPIVSAENQFDQQTPTEMYSDKDKEVKVKVSGKCGMCKSRIEKAATAIKGVSKASWDAKTGELSITYKAKKTSVEAVQKAIAKVGHDSGKFKADDKVYSALPGCCKYDRGDK